MIWICFNLLRSHFLFCLPWWPLIDAGSQPPAIWQAALVAKIWCMWVHLLKYGSVFLKCLGSFCFFEMSLKCLVTKLLIVSAWFLVHVGWFMFQRFWIEILIGFWFMLPYFLKGAANWKGSHWILRFLNNPLIKSEVLIDMILQSSHWILLSMDSMVYGFLQHFAING